MRQGLQTLNGSQKQGSTALRHQKGFCFVPENPGSRVSGGLRWNRKVRFQSTRSSSTRLLSPVVTIRLNLFAPDGVMKNNY